MRYFVLLCGAAAMLFTTDAYDYLSNLRQGLNLGKIEVPWIDQGKRKIPAKQCTGEVEYPRDYYCGSSEDNYPPQMLQVDVQDDVGPPRIIISSKLTNATVYRVACEGSAIISISVQCGLYR